MSSDQTPTKKPPDNTRVIVSVVAAIAVVWFAIANSQRVNVSWWFFDRQSRLIYVIVVAAVLGAIADRFILSHRKKDKR